MRVMNLFAGAVIFLSVLTGPSATARTIDFEDIVLDDESDLRVVLDEDEEIVSPGFLSSGGALFNNETQPWGFSGGFLVSNRTDTMTPGFDSTVGDFGEVVNDSSSFAGTGAAGSSNFAVAFGYLDSLDPSEISQLEQLPHVLLPEDYAVVSAEFTNTTWAGISMQKGDTFAKSFGGLTGGDPDFFRLSVYGSQEGVPLADSVDLMLADFRSENNEDDFILDEWRQLDLAPLADADRLYFNLESSDVGDFGMNTPSYFAIDNIELRELTGTLGDFSGDQILDVADVDLLCSGVASGGEDLQFDLNADGLVDSVDVAELLVLAGGQAGDANLDSVVDFADFLILSASFGESTNWSSGDFDCDGEVEFSDFLILSGNFGQTLAAHSVPEPTSAYTIVVVFASVCACRRRSSRRWSV